MQATPASNQEKKDVFINSESDQSYSSLSNNENTQSTKRKAVSDSTSLSSFNSTQDDKAAADALEAKREYNRKSAARARKRQKSLVADLQKKAHEVEKELRKQQRENDILRAKMDIIMAQNKDLLRRQGMSNAPANQVAPSLQHHTTSNPIQRNTSGLNNTIDPVVLLALHLLR